MYFLGETYDPYNKIIQFVLVIIVCTLYCVLQTIIEEKIHHGSTNGR